MKAPMENVPHLIAHFRNMAESARKRHQDALKRAERATDPGLRKIHQGNAESDLEIALAFEADADELTEKFKAAGGEMHRLQ